MKIIILSRSARIHSTKRLRDEALKRGHEVLIVDPLKCYMDISTVEPLVLYKKKKLMGFDAVIPRIGSSITFYGLAILRQFEMMRVFPLNESVAIGRSRDKLRSLQILSRERIGLPKTGFAHSTKMTKDLIKLVGGAPLVVKLLEGTQGEGVVLAETTKAAESVIDAFRKLNANFLVQEFIKEAAGCDIRCFVIGNKVVASMQRKAQEGEFRSNLHRGGSAKVVAITKAEKELAIKAAKAMGLNIAGVDLIRSKSGAKVLEVNSSPGLEGIEKATGKNIAKMIIEFTEKNARVGKTQTKGKG